MKLYNHITGITKNTSSYDLLIAFKDETFAGGKKFTGPTAFKAAMKGLGIVPVDEQDGYSAADCAIVLTTGKPAMSREEALTNIRIKAETRLVAEKRKVEKYELQTKLFAPRAEAIARAVCADEIPMYLHSVGMTKEVIGDLVTFTSTDLFKETVAQAKVA